MAQLVDGGREGLAESGSGFRLFTGPMVNGFGLPTTPGAPEPEQPRLDINLNEWRAPVPTTIAVGDSVLKQQGCRPSCPATMTALPADVAPALMPSVDAALTAAENGEPMREILGLAPGTFWTIAAVVAGVGVVLLIATR